MLSEAFVCSGGRVLCPGGFLSGGVSFQGVSVHRGGLCHISPMTVVERAVHILLECILVPRGVNMSELSGGSRIFLRGGANSQTWVC